MVQKRQRRPDGGGRVQIRRDGGVRVRTQKERGKSEREWMCSAEEVSLAAMVIIPRRM